MTYSVDSLWKAKDAADATGGKAVCDWNATGVSIDSRTVRSGDLFIALQGPNFDGHDFVIDAIGRGASASLISYRPKGIKKETPLLEVSDTFSGLNSLGIAGRARTRAKIIAVTGSVGKTSVKEAIAKLLSRQGSVSYSHGGLNNQYGVPLSLARLPKNTEFGVFELGMNRAGELTDLSRMVRPLVAVVTTVELAHLEFFESKEEIARAKAEIFGGLQNCGVAILNRDNFGYGILKKAAISVGANVVSFGFHQEADFKVNSFELFPEGSLVQASFDKQELSFRLNIPGPHSIRNSLAVLAAIHSIGGDVFEAAQALGDVTPIQGRGLHHLVRATKFGFELIDDSYNANPASVSAALEVLSQVSVKSSGRRLAVLGDMLELGHKSQALHLELATKVIDKKIDLVYAVGLEMRHMFDALPSKKRGHWSETSDELLGVLVSNLKNNDVVLVKGSLGARMGLIVNGLIKLGEKG